MPESRPTLLSGCLQFGQLGIGSTVDKNVPTRVIGPLHQADVVTFSCGWRHNFAATAAGEVYSWGRGGTGQLGHGSTDDVYASSQTPNPKS